MPRRSELTELPPDTKPQRGIPWDEIADGNIWELVQGEDFKGQPAGVETRIRAKARAMGRGVQTRVQEPGRNRPPVILVQFSAPAPSGNDAGDGGGG